MPPTPEQVTLIAPLSGVLVPIERVPDPVFAEKMVGEGLSIDPTSNVLLAPVDGEVTLIHPSFHAVTVRHASGLEVLLHIGLDTVSMRGEGFEPQVALGTAVKLGDPLIRFDMDKIATEAKSLLTQVVISNSDVLGAFAVETGVVVAGRDPVAVASVGAVAADDTTAGEAVAAAAERATSEAVLVLNPTGLHARPAAMLAGLAKKHEGAVRLQRGTEQVNAKSLVAVMGLSVAKGDKVQVIATGPGARAAVDELAAAIADGLGEDVSAESVDTAAATALPAPTEAPLTRRTSDDPNLLLGVAASPGVAVGTVFQWQRHRIDVTEEASDKHLERRKLNSALDRSILQLKALEDQLKQQADADKAAIFAAHQELLSDPDFLDLATSAIDKGKSAPWAWQKAYEVYANRLAGLSNEVLAGRAADVRDVGRRVLEELTGQKSAQPEIPRGSVLVAEDLTPSDTATLDRERVAGFCTTGGGATSHVAIIARSLDIPAVAGIEARVLDLPAGSQVVLDGTAGTVRINVTDDEVRAMRLRQQSIAAKRTRDLATAHEAAVTLDGVRIEVAANIGNLADANDGVTKGGEGVGLLRSEFVFLGRSSAPTEDEQAAIYTDIANALGKGEKLVIRTLDVGGDKPLPYLPIPREENPFLGERGIRVGLDRPDVLRAQVRAILRAAHDGQADVHLMFPMVSTIEDYRLGKRVVEEEAAALGFGSDVPVGIMVEVPSVAVMAEAFAKEAAFFSVGTNDLTQYTLAMDRGHPKLAPQIDALNPAVIGLIANACRQAHKHGRWVGVCGGVASDPQAVPILIGIGVDELSVSIPAIPAVKAQIRALSKTECVALAAKALAADSAESVRALVPLADV